MSSQQEKWDEYMQRLVASTQQAARELEAMRTSFTHKCNILPLELKIDELKREITLLRENLQRKHNVGVVRFRHCHCCGYFPTDYEGNYVSSAPCPICSTIVRLRLGDTFQNQR